MTTFLFGSQKNNLMGPFGEHSVFAGHFMRLLSSYLNNYFDNYKMKVKTWVLQDLPCLTNLQVDTIKDWLILSKIFRKVTAKFPLLKTCFFWCFFYGTHNCVLQSWPFTKRTPEGLYSMC